MRRNALAENIARYGWRGPLFGINGSAIAITSMLGTRMWVHSGWFDRYVPDVDIEGAALEHQRAPQTVAGAV